MSQDHNDVLLQARRLAIPLAQQIAIEANTKSGIEVGKFAGSCAALVLQTTVVSMLVTKFPPGSQEGQAVLEELYDNAKKDAIERWHKSDLKERGFGPRGRG